MKNVSKEIIEQAQKGNEEAFTEIFETYRKTVYNIVYMLVHNEAEIEELTQRVFIRIWQKIDTFNFKSAFSTWLYRVAHNICQDYFREKERDKQHEEELKLFLQEFTRKPPDSNIDQREFREIIRRVLLKIPEKLRYPVIYYDMQGMSYAEISNIIGIPQGTVKSRLYRGRQKLSEEVRNISGRLPVKLLKNKGIHS